MTVSRAGGTEALDQLKERGTSLEQIICASSATYSHRKQGKNSRPALNYCLVLRQVDRFLLLADKIFILSGFHLETALNTADTSRFPSNYIHVLCLHLCHHLYQGCMELHKETKQGEETLKLRSFTWHKVPV